MKEVKVLKNQTLVDLAVQELGDASRAVELAVLNEMQVTDHLVAGTLVTVPDYERGKRSMVTLFADDSNKPASASSGYENDLEGIDYWQIENDFIVQ